MLTWTDHLTILTHGQDSALDEPAAKALDRFDIGVRTTPIERIAGSAGRVEQVIFRDGTEQEFDALFFHIAIGPGCSIPAELGCEADEDGILETNADLETTVPGVYAAGDIVRGSKLAISAAADGTRAAVGIYRSLLPKERKI